MWYASASPVIVAPGSTVMMPPAGEKPSRPMNGVLSTWSPFVSYAGSVVSPKYTCIPVTCVESGTVQTLDGYGSPQCEGTMGSQSSSRSGGALGVGAAGPCELPDELHAVTSATGARKAR